MKRVPAKKTATRAELARLAKDGALLSATLVITGVIDVLPPGMQRLSRRINKTAPRLLR